MESGPQGVPAPHAHVPALQPSLRPPNAVVQSTHAAPGAPHVVVDTGLHPVPSQQPDAHDVTSQLEQPVAVQT
jgi:hypothetical protein